MSGYSRFTSRYLPYVFLIGCMLLLALLPQQWQDVLYFNHSAISNGQMWRVFSGHLLHSNVWHLAMNSAGVLLVMLLHGHYYRFRTLALHWGCYALTISAALYFFSTDIQVYMGLSGMLHAMLIQGALTDIRLKMTTGWLLLIGVIAKVGWEQWHGPDADLAKLIDANVATDAHLYGVVSALLFAMLLAIISAVLPRAGGSKTTP